MKTPSKAPAQADEKLTRLLEIERRLEDRLREAEREGRRRVESTRAAAEQVAAAGKTQLEQATREEERADLDAHARELGRLETEGAERVKRWAACADADVDRLAREALKMLILEAAS
jgi:hypothetical protein